MDFGAFIGNLTGFDLVFFLVLFGFFVLGFAQGTIRRLLGLGALMFSFLFAANLRDPLGAFLAQNWTQFPDEYAYMIGFGVIFLAAFIDEVIGGLLGMLEAVLLFTIIIIILDSFFLIPGIPESGNELHFLRDFWDWMNPAQVTAFFRESILPIFFALFGLFVPDDIEQLVTGP